MWIHGAGSTGAATFPTSAPVPLCWEVIRLIKGFSHGPEFLEGLFSSHKSLYNALSHVISPVLCHLSMQCFRVLRNQRADVGADPQPAQHQLRFGVELWPLTPAVLVLSKWNRKRSQLPNATVSDSTEVPQTGPKIAASQPLVVVSVTDTQRKRVLQSVFQVYMGKKAGTMFSNKSVLLQLWCCQNPLENVCMNTELGRADHE